MIKVNGKVIEQNHFPDGTQLLKLIYTGPKCEIEWKYENDSELFTLYCLVRKLRDKDFNNKLNIELFLTYIPNARQDRVKNPEDIFTLKYFCEIINSLNFDTIYVLDAHSNVSLALLDKVIEIKPWKYIEKAIHKIPADRELMLFYPDEGAMKRYSDGLNLPFAFGVKKRDWSSGEILGLDIIGSDVAGKNILIIDDICSRGGTFYHAAKKLKEAGAADIYLYITHCEDTIYEGELLKEDSLIKKIYTTDSLLTKTDNNRIEVITSYYA